MALAGCSSELRSAPPGLQDAPGYYPPTLTGLRGSHPGSFEVAHALRDGRRWDDARRTDELYDLIVVGGGISGLAAACFYRERVSRSSRILILENHDDFGGHARRNEFDLGGRLQLMNGGTWSIESPGPYSAVADGLVSKLGIDIAMLAKTTQDDEFYAARGLHSAVFFDRETFGADKLVVRDEERPWKEFLAQAPLTDAVRRDIERLEEASVDYLPGLSSDEKKARLSAISYQEFLTKVAQSDPGVCAFYQAQTHGLWCVGIEAVSALDCWAIGLPGFQGLGLRPGSIPRMGYTAAGVADHDWSEVVHFPDGNATIARALVRELIPAAASAGDLAQLITARFDYGKLDRPEAGVRLRLNSTVTRVQNVDSKSPSEVDVTYVRSGTAFRARTRHCILACWNGVIPYLCPELPSEQKAALASPEKTPLVYASVALRNWVPFAKLGISDVHAPGSYYSSVDLNEAVRFGGYSNSRNPEEPTLIRLTRTPCAPGLTEREQNRAGRAELLATPFATFELHLRDQLTRILGPAGFDAARDITAITVNRWPHGYAHEYNPLFDDLLPKEKQPHIVGRARFGNIAIANSDAGAAAYTDSAINEAHRSVGEILSD